MFKKLVLLMVAVFSVSAMAFGLDSVTSAAKGDDEGSKVATKNFVDAVSNLSKAQVKFATALGLKEEAKKAEAVSNSLGKGTLDSSKVKDDVSTTDAVNTKIAEAMKTSKPLSEASKKTFAEGIAPYSVGMINTGLLVKNAKEIRGIGTGMAIAKNTPKLLQTVSSTSSQVMSFAKTNKIDTSKMASVNL
jgi:hypothetical protein